jgi:hypothetical protein
MLPVLKLPCMLLAPKLCPSWTPSMFQVSLALQALILKLKAEAIDPPGAMMHVLAAFIATQSVCEIAGHRAAVAALNPAVLLLEAGLLLMAALAMSTAMLVNAVTMAWEGKREHLLIEI